MPATHYANNSILNYQFRGDGFNNNPYIGLSTTLIDEYGLGGTEPESSYNYTRVSGSSVSWYFSTSSFEGGAYNTSAISFPTCSESWGIITEIFIVNGQTGGMSGSILYHTKLSPTIPTYAGTKITINPGGLVVTERI